ncbi:hypothetical protein KGM_214985 [Danaus plexippus plexippus]|uniref:Uncharacterized protein n=1 Tax=Danaus plexippus plexippus TaxID=278856 RepID=A0A212ENY1_DANPL|nr:hypothetical protein KGM_214985 [Danaus plexippus plexippus]
MNQKHLTNLRVANVDERTLTSKLTAMDMDKVQTKNM